MKLSDYAKSSTYLKWVDTDTHDICCPCSYEDLCELQPTFNDRHNTEQYEIPIFVVSTDKVSESVLATKSKTLIVQLLSCWEPSPQRIIRLKKTGTGFYTKWTTTISNKYYDMASGKIVSKA